MIAQAQLFGANKRTGTGSRFATRDAIENREIQKTMDVDDSRDPSLLPIVFAVD